MYVCMYVHTYVCLWSVKDFGFKVLNWFKGYLILPKHFKFIVPVYMLNFDTMTNLDAI